jgi:Regulator of G protein signaling domain
VEGNWQEREKVLFAQMSSISRKRKPPQGMSAGELARRWIESSELDDEQTSSGLTINKSISADCVDKVCQRRRSSLPELIYSALKMSKNVASSSSTSPSPIRRRFCRGSPVSSVTMAGGGGGYIAVASSSSSSCPSATAAAAAAAAGYGDFGKFDVHIDARKRRRRKDKKRRKKGDGSLDNSGESSSGGLASLPSSSSPSPSSSKTAVAASLLLAKEKGASRSEAPATIVAEASVSATLTPRRRSSKRRSPRRSHSAPDQAGDVAKAKSKVQKDEKGDRERRSSKKKRRERGDSTARRSRREQHKQEEAERNENDDEKEVAVGKRTTFAAAVPVASSSRDEVSGGGGGSSSVGSVSSFSSSYSMRHGTKPTYIIMKLVLRSTSSADAFDAFLRSEYSEENCQFWQLVDRLHRLAADTHVPVAKLRELAQRIWDSYFTSRLAALNIPSAVLADVRKRFHEHAQSDERKRVVAIFDKAQKEIFSLMLHDSLPRFLRSPHYETVGDLALRRHIADLYTAVSSTPLPITPRAKPRQFSSMPGLGSATASSSTAAVPLHPSLAESAPGDMQSKKKKKKWFRL